MTVKKCFQKVFQRLTPKQRSQVEEHLQSALDVLKDIKSNKDKSDPHTYPFPFLLQFPPYVASLLSYGFVEENE
jgi:hypothetical protein